MTKRITKEEIKKLALSVDKLISSGMSRTQAIAEIGMNPSTYYRHKNLAKRNNNKKSETIVAEEAMEEFVFLIPASKLAQFLEFVR